MNAAWLALAVGTTTALIALGKRAGQPRKPDIVGPLDVIPFRGNGQERDEEATGAVGRAGSVEGVNDLLAVGNLLLRGKEKDFHRSAQAAIAQDQEIG